MRGTYYGAQSFAGLGLVIGPWLSSLLLDLFGSRAMFMMMAVIALLSILFYWRGHRLSQLNVKPSSVA